ncbi:MAG: ParB/Srx family N-terminal domain-containing protein [Thiomicrorhabdus sp.]|jgi:ParB family chromosome partitioning protein|nr:ParB/Srx family N-terminal domain-containing protein [Thiomicrorhabdus sp.]
MAKMNIIYIDPEELKGYAGNSRVHSGTQIDQLVKSMTEFGFTNPVLVDGRNEIIAGHGRIMAAKKMNLETVPCIVLDHLTELQKKAYVIADNKLALNAEWSEDLLASELQKLIDEDYTVAVTGFDDAELDKILGNLGEDELDDDDDSELPQALQIEPPKEYALIMCDSPEEWEQLKHALNLTPVRRGGYKKGSAFDSVSTQRVVRASLIIEGMSAKKVSATGGKK